MTAPRVPFFFMATVLRSCWLCGFLSHVNSLSRAASANTSNTGNSLKFFPLATTAQLLKSLWHVHKYMPKIIFVHLNHCANKILCVQFLRATMTQKCFHMKLLHTKKFNTKIPKLLYLYTCIVQSCTYTPKDLVLSSGIRRNFQMGISVRKYVWFV